MQKLGLCDKEVNCRNALDELRHISRVCLVNTYEVYCTNMMLQ